MKKIAGLAIMVMIAGSLFAQVKEGKIIYEQKINMHKRLPPQAEQFKAMIPEFQTNILELYFNSTQSLFKPAKVQGDQLPSADVGGGGGGMRLARFSGMGGGGSAETFRDYDNETMVESRELGPKKYLIEDSLKPIKWKLENETMTIAGFECKKATTTVQAFGMAMGNRPGGAMSTRSGEQRTPRGDSTIRKMMEEKQEVVAWYTDQIESSAGPDNYFGLPGLILYLDVDNGTMVYTPVKLEPLGKELVVAPTKGNKITKEEYRKMMQQQFQGMGVRPAVGSRVIIRE